MSTLAAIVGAAGQQPSAAQVDVLMAQGLYPGASPPKVVLDGTAALAASTLPLTDEDTLDEQPPTLGRLRVALAGRLDNRAELTTSLDVPKAASDVMMAAAAYRNWGSLCPQRLVGSFALIVLDGQRNHLFAQTLFITVKTVEWHLSQAFRKLGVTRRGELARAISHPHANGHPVWDGHRQQKP